MTERAIQLPDRRGAALSRAKPLVLAMMSGSLRSGSLNTAALRAAARIAAQIAPCQIRVTMVGIGEMPHFNADLDASGFPGVGRVLSALQQADGLLVATPEYNGHPPGVLKNALDWAACGMMANPLAGLATSTLSASPGQHGGSCAQQQLRDMLRRCGATIVGDPVAIGRASATAVDGGEFTDPGTCARIAAAVAPLVAARLAHCWRAVRQ